MLDAAHDGTAAPGPSPASGPAATGRRHVTITPGTIWLVTGILVALAITAYILAQAIQIFVLLFVAITFAEAIRPVMDWLHKHGIPRAAGVLLTYLGLVVIFAFLVYLLLRPIVAQIGQLQHDLPRYAQVGQQFVGSLQHFFGQNPQLAQALQRVEGQFGGLITNVLQYVLYIPVLVASGLVAIVAIIAMAFFWLTGTDELLPFVVGLFPERSQLHVRSIFEEMGQRLGGYVRGVVFNMFVIGILSGVGDFVLGVPYAVLLGILAGLTEILPYVGPWIGGSAAVLVALFAGGLVQGLIVAGWYIVLQVLEGHTLVPVVMFRAVRVNPLTVIVAVLIGGTLYGIIGGVLAVPVAAMLQVLLVRVLAPAARNAAARKTAERQRAERREPDRETPGQVAAPAS